MSKINTNVGTLISVSNNFPIYLKLPGLILKEKLILNEKIDESL